MSWYRIHRPQKIEDLDLDNVRSIFQEMMKTGKVPQALIFAGPKGTGKTSSSRIIGALLNDKQNEAVIEHVYFDQKPSKNLILEEPDPSSDFAKKVSMGKSYVVQEMDAASNRGIDDVRSLRERVMLPPQEGKMAVYILDEAHMLTTEAFNALLKLLEEPPPHSVFILATTEFHKIPETIVSRCVVVPFRKANDEEIKRSLKRILDKEKIKHDVEALDVVISHADGSFRDAVKLLELASQSGKLSLESVQKIVGSSHDSTAESLINAVVDKDSKKVSTEIGILRDSGIDVGYFHKLLFTKLHNALLQDIGVVDGKPFVNKKIAQFLLSELLKADLDGFSPIPFLPLEIKLLEIIDRASKKKSNVSIKKNNDDDSGDSSESNGQEDKDEGGEKDIPIVQETSSDRDMDSYDGDSKLLFDRWDEFLKAVSNKNSTLAALLHSSRPMPESSNGIAKVGVYYQFHQEQLMQDKFRDIIEECGLSLIGKKIAFDFSLQEMPVKNDLKKIENIPEEKPELVALAVDTLM